MKNTKWFAVVLALTFLLSAALPAHAQADQGRFWYEDTIWSDCANGGNGELIQLAGYMHVSFRFTFDNAGGVHVKAQANPQGISGYGLITGDEYRGTGVSQDMFNLKFGEQTTYINNFLIIGQGSGNNLLVHSVWHYTFNADGTLTAWVDNSRSECR